MSIFPAQAQKSPFVVVEDFLATVLVTLL